VKTWPTKSGAPSSFLRSENGEGVGGGGAPELQLPERLQVASRFRAGRSSLPNPSLIFATQKRGRGFGVLAVGIALASLLGTSGCSSTAEASGNQTVELNFWNGFSGPDGPMMEKIVKQFNAEHKDVHVTMQIIPWATYYEKVTLGLAFGGAPDVFIVHAGRLPEYAHYGALANLDSFIKDDKLPVEDFAPRPWDAAAYKGTHYGVPLDCHPVALFYNTKLFKEAGIDHPPTNLTEFIEDGKKLTKDLDGDGKPDQWGYGFVELHQTYYSLLNQFGTALLTPDLKKAAIEAPPARQALRMMQDLYKKYKIAPRPAGNDAWLGFRNGRYAMVMQGIYMKADLDNQNGLEYAAAPLPQLGPQPGAMAGSHIMAMPATLSPERKKLAWTFIRYLSDHSIQWAAGGQVPIRKSILASKEFKEMPVQYQFSRELPWVYYEPRSVSLNQIVSFGDSAIDTCMNEDGCESAIETATRRIDKVLGRE